jgi:hypothetical protein
VGQTARPAAGVLGTDRDLRLRPRVARTMGAPSIARARGLTPTATTPGWPSVVVVHSEAALSETLPEWCGDEACFAF